MSVRYDLTAVEILKLLGYKGRDFAGRTGQGCEAASRFV